MQEHSVVHTWTDDTLVKTWDMIASIIIKPSERDLRDLFCMELTGHINAYINNMPQMRNIFNGINGSMQ